MSRIDLENLLKEISPEAPSGEEASSADLSELSRNTEPKQDPDGKVLSKPNWKEIQKTALELLGNTHDLRLAVILARALIEVQGISGLYDGLRLIRGFIEQYWDTVYPLLDVEDDNDPTERINVLWELNDDNRFISPIMRIPLCDSTKMGRYGLRDIHIANKIIKPVATDEEAGKELPGIQLIDAAFKDSDPEILQKIQRDVDNALKEVKALKKVLDEKVEPEDSVKFDQLVNVLENVNKIMADRIGQAPQISDEQNRDENTNISQPDQIVSAPVSMNPGPIRSRRDIHRMLDVICDYYAENEPASPVPLLLKRAGRLVEKNFMEILEDMAPDSVKKIQSLVGVTEAAKEKKSKE
nr:type VI secretion system protein TssA [uncultured Desulfobacter sp.]